MDRLHTLRRDEAWLATQLAGPHARFLPVWRNRNLVGEADPVRSVPLTRLQLGELFDSAESVTLLGGEEGLSWFGVGLSSENEEVPRALGAFGRFRELREVLGLLEAREGALLAHARALVWWHRRQRFCGDCGHPTASSEGGHVRICTDPDCGRLHFPRTDPAIIVLVASGARCLLGRQAAWPGRRYSTIAGFVEPGETLEEAVRREVLEETGVPVGEVRYHSSQPWPFPASLMLGFTASAEGEEIRLEDDELEDARWFSRGELRDALLAGTVGLPGAFSIAYRLIQDWYDSGDQGALADLPARLV